MRVEMISVADFYSNVDEVRQFAMGQEFHEEPHHYPGKRTNPFLNDSTKEIIQDIPKLYHIKFDLLKRRLKQQKSSSILNEFETRFTGVYEQYYEKLKSLAPELSPNDLRICALMRLNISTKEIALLTNRTIGTVDNTRSSIRKKLKLDEETNLQEFLLDV